MGEFVQKNSGQKEEKQQIDGGFLGVSQAHQELDQVADESAGGKIKENGGEDEGEKR